MGNCANSKYAVDEDKKPKTKKIKDKKNKGKEVISNGNTKQVKTETLPTKNEEIDFIDKEEHEKQQAAAKTEDDDVKKETTTYQTTVVKHTQKEGDELMQHLKDEAFKTLQNLLKHQDPTQTTKTTTTATSSANATPETTTSSDSSAEDIVEQIKSQVVASLGKNRQDFINSVIDSGIELIKENKVKNMNDLQTSLESKFPNTTENGDNSEFIKKVINGTTGFLTAKGTEAGALLSSILANVSSGLQGVMNETEKTTVKVTRTVTEQLMSGGQIKEITKVITRTEPTVTINPNINEIIKNLSGENTEPILTSPTKVTNTGKTTTTSTSVICETLESLPKELTTTVSQESADDLKTKEQAEKVVSTVVSAAVEQVNEEKSDEEFQKVSTTLTNGTNPDDTEDNDVQSEFYKHGKKAAEEAVIKINDLSEPTTA